MFFDWEETQKLGGDTEPNLLATSTTSVLDQLISGSQDN